MSINKKYVNLAAQLRAVADIKKAILAENLTKISGVDVEIVVRGLREFTFCFDGDHPDAVKKIFSFLEKQIKTSTSEYDQELDMTCIFVTV